MIRRRVVLIGFSGLLVLAGADTDGPTMPKSPKATDAIRIDNAAVKKATAAYWAVCQAADRKLENELKTAADAAHARNDGKEEKACRDAAKDVQERIDTESRGYSAMIEIAPLKQLRCETRPS